MGALLPPAQINTGLQLPVAPVNVDDLKMRILEFIRAQDNPNPPIEGVDAALACTAAQGFIVSGRLHVMQYDPRFAAVLASGAGGPLTHKLGFFYIPRPRSAAGRLDKVSFATHLWN